jgi:hypothetical protein
MKQPLLVLFTSLALWPSGPLASQAARYDGRPVFAEDTELGYYIWRDTGADSTSWHMRWTTKGLMRRFQGNVTAEGGKLKSLHRVDVETESRVLYPGRPAHVVRGPLGGRHVVPGRGPVVVTKEQDKIEKDGDQTIRWFTRTDDVDGFDFKVDNEVQLLRFALMIEGTPRPMLVQAGRENWKPGVMPVVVKLK